MSRMSAQTRILSIATTALGLIALLLDMFTDKWASDEITLIKILVILIWARQGLDGLE